MTSKNSDIPERTNVKLVFKEFLQPMAHEIHRNHSVGKEEVAIKNYKQTRKMINCRVESAKSTS